MHMLASGTGLLTLLDNVLFVESDFIIRLRLTLKWSFFCLRLLKAGITCTTPCSALMILIYVTFFLSDVIKDLGNYCRST